MREYISPNKELMARIPSSKILKDIYKRLYNKFGRQHWWPGDTAFEVMVGAILTQNTSWKNVEKAIKNIDSGKLLDPFKLYGLRDNKLARLIRPAGYYNVKTRRLKNYLKLFISEYGADVHRMKKMPLAKLRNSLLTVNGIGKETADSILLYALNRPVFVIDAYTRRFLSRHNLIKRNATYDQLQGLFTRNLPNEAKLFNEYHALIVRLCKELCKSKPDCKECPLYDIL